MTTNKGSKASAKTTKTAAPAQAALPEAKKAAPPAPKVDVTPEAKAAPKAKKAKRSYLAKLGALLTRTAKQLKRIDAVLRASDNDDAKAIAVNLGVAALNVDSAQELLIELPGDFKPAKVKGAGLSGKKAYEPGDKVEIKAKHAALYEIEPGVLLVSKMAGDKRVVVTDGEGVRHSLHTAHVLPEGVEAKRAAAKAERDAKKAAPAAV